MIEERATSTARHRRKRWRRRRTRTTSEFVNPPLARVMKLSGSPVEVRAQGCTIWDQTGKAYLDFAGGYGVFTLGYSPSARRRGGARAARADRALRQDDVQRAARTRRAPARRARAGRPADFVLVQQRHRGDRRRDQTRARRDRRAKIVGTLDAYHGKTLGALSVSGRETLPVAVSSAACRLDLRYRTARPDALERGAARCGRLRRRAGAGRRRRQRAAAGLSAGRARGVRSNRSALRCRRGADRIWGAADIALRAIATASCPT